MISFAFMTLYDGDSNAVADGITLIPTNFKMQNNVNDYFF